MPENGRTVFRRDVDDLSKNGVTGVTVLRLCN